MPTQITILGDVHADWDSLDKAIANNSNTDVFIQVGDLGLFPNSGFFPLKGFKKPLYFIDGNHDDHSFLAYCIKNNKLEIVKNCFYISRGSTKEFDGVKINFMGGALSIDKHVRTEGLDWWREEIPSYEEFNRFANLDSADIVVTHAAPSFVTKGMFVEKESDVVAKTLDKIWNMWDNKPKLWLFGHYHVPIKIQVKDTLFMCIPCTHDHDVPANSGLTLIFDNGQFNIK